MDMQTFIRTLEQIDREDFATRAGTTVGYLYQIAGGHRRPSPQKALELVKASGGTLRMEDLRPDIYPAPAGQPSPQDAPVGADQEVTEATG